MHTRAFVFAALAVLLVLLAAASLPVLAAGSVTGTVTKNSAALSGARVNVIDSLNVSRETTTSGTGAYTISGVADGDAHVYCYSPNTKLIEHRIVTIAGAALTANFDWQVGDISGTIKKNGSVLPNAKVKIIDVNNNWYEAITGAGGVYSITSVTAGAVGAYCYDTDHVTQIGYKTWSVAKGITVTINFDAWFFGSVQATVTRGGAAYGGARVETHDALGNWNQATTAGTGVCMVTNVAVGPVDVYAYTAEGWLIGQQAITMTQDAVVPVSFNWGNGTLNVTVTRNGAPLAGAWVQCAAVSGTTSAAGQVTLTPESGHRTLSVFHNIAGSVNHGYLIEAREVQFITGQTLNETFTWSAGTISGTITKYGAVLPNATVGVVGRGFVATDANGEYTIDVSSGAQTLTFNSPVPDSVIMGTYDLPVAQGGSYLVDFDWRAPKTTVGGTINADTTWTPENSPYIVTSDIVVNAGKTLTVMPGTRVYFSPGTGMTVNGTLDARGPTPDSIHFGSRQEMLQPSTALPGDWEGIVLNGTGSSGSQLDYCSVVYAGAGANSAAIYLASSSAQITNSEVSFSSTRGLVADNPSGPVVASNSFVGNAGVPLSVGSATAFQCTDNIGTGNADGNVIEIRSGDCIGDHTWHLNGLEYRVTGDIVVRSTANGGTGTLTIEPGCTLRFAPSTGIYCGYSYYGWYFGKIVADGTPEDPITFAAVDAAAGHWKGIYLRPGTAAGTLFDNCVFEDAGAEWSAGNSAAVYCESASPAVTNSVFSRSSGYGINADDGALPTINACVFQNNGSYPIGVHPHNAHEIVGNTGSGNAPADEIEVRSGHVTADQTWHLNAMPYRVQGDVLVRYVDTSGTPTTLTIEPGCVLKFAAGAYLRTGYSYYGWHIGKLVAQGTSVKPITFTSVEAGQGKWGGIVFQDGTADVATILDRCVVENGVNNITCQSSNPTITNCTIRNGSGYGIHADDSSAPTVHHNVFTGNANYPIGLYPDRAGFCSLAANTGTGNLTNEIEIRGGDVRNSQTWPKDGMPYRVSGTVTVYGPEHDVANPCVLTVAPGCTLSFADATSFTFGYSYYGWYWGKLIAQGASGQPITFTAVNKTPGAWQGLLFKDGGSDDSVLENCVVEYTGGSSRNAGIRCESCTPAISQCTVRNGIGFGIYADNGAAPSLQDNVISGQTGYPVSLYCEKVGYCQLAGNTGSGNLADEIEVRGGEVRSSQTWPKDGMVYRVTGSVTVYGADQDVNNPAVLTIAPGCTLKFADDTTLFTGYNSYGWYWGMLLAQGTEDQPITFTAVTAEPGKWNGILMRHGTHADTVLEHCIVEYAGATGSTTSVQAQDCSPALTDCEIRSSGDFGLYADDSAAPVVTRCSFTDNVGFPVSFHWSRVDSIMSVSGTGNQAGNEIQLRPANITANTHLRVVGMAYRFVDDASVYNGATLLVDHGVVMKFNGRFNVGHPTSNNAGTARLLGTADDPIVMTASNGQAGGWGGVYIAPWAGGLTELRHVIISHGGGNEGTKSNLYVNSTAPKIVNCDIFRGAQNGVTLATATPIKNCIVTENANFGVIGSGSWVTYTDIWANEGGNTSGAAVGVGCKSVNPYYVAPSAGDFHLQARSTCIDAGDPAMVDMIGSRMDMGAWSILGTPTPPISLGSAKAAVDGTIALIEDRPIVAVYGNAFNIENDDRSAGLRIVSTDPVEVGQRVTVAGVMATQDGERYIPATQVKQMPVPEGSLTPAPLGVTNKNTGGGPAGAAPGVRGGVGVNNVGLLARAFGWVTAVVPDGFYINDGSNLASDGGNTGLKVATTGLLAGRTIGVPEVGRYVTVTGAIGARQVESVIYPVIRPRAQSDLFYEQARVSIDTLENGLGAWAAMPDSDMLTLVSNVWHSPTHSAFADQDSVASMRKATDLSLYDRVYLRGFIRDGGGSGAFGRAYIGFRAMDEDVVKDYFSIGIWSLTSSANYCFRTSAQGWMASSIARTPGWHAFAIAVRPYTGTDDVSFYVDGALAGKGKRTVNWPINDIQVGPSNTPAGANAWYDDIEFGVTEWAF